MINRAGLAGLNKNISTPNGSQGKIPNSLLALNNKVKIGRVTDIILNENHPDFSRFGEFNSI